MSFVHPEILIVSTARQACSKCTYPLCAHPPLFTSEAHSLDHTAVVALGSGRTNQIRLQCAAVAAPVVGDTRCATLAGLLTAAQSLGPGVGELGGGAPRTTRPPHGLGRKCKERVATAMESAWGPW